MMDVRELYDLCCDCKYAVRNKGGNPIGCTLVGPRITDEACEDYRFWWTKPPRTSWKRRIGWVSGILLAMGVALVTLVALLLVRLVRWILPRGVPSDFYIPKVSPDFYLPGRRSGKKL